VLDAFHAFNEWFADLPALWTYCVLLAVAYGENVLPPIPGDLLIAYAGLLAGTGALGLAPVIAVATVGGTLGFMTVYAVGDRLGEAIDDPDRLAWLPAAQVARARWWLRERGRWVILLNRFLPGIRSVVGLAAGASDFSARSAAVLSFVSALAWTSAIASLGYLAGDNLAQVEGFLRLYGKVVGTLLVAALVGWWSVRWARKRRRSA
jgi:membrane protein DedA with SNARE-associated domain